VLATRVWKTAGKKVPFLFVVIALTAVLCICIAGVAGLLYSGWFFVGGDKRSYYKRFDRITYAVLPFSAYGLLVLGGALLLHDTQRGLTFAAIGMLLLLAIGIRNSWAIAIAIVAYTVKIL
jgi:hypothetical protein